ncbi:MAG: tetratricopeptide repeat protein [Anaerolineales bacterium]|nr:tetratricopeptide repeat protein [Anaerolineales bacterium]
MKISYRLLSILLLLVVPAQACTRSANGPLFGPTHTPTYTITPTATPVPTSTPTPLPTPTPEPSARVDSGDHAIFNGDWENAIKEYQSALTFSQDPQVQAAALLGLGRAYLSARNLYQAITHLEKLINEYPDAPQIAQAYFYLARAYEAQENYPLAADGYYNYLIHRPGVIDAYILDLRGDALFSAGDYTRAAESFQAALQSPSQLDGSFLQMKLARAYSVSGDYLTALNLYDDLYYRTTNEYTRALIDLRKGQAYTALGQIEQAHAAYLDAVQNYPTAYDSYTALVALVEAGVTVDELNRGIVDYYAGEYGVAMAAFDRYLQGSPTDPATAFHYYGLTARAQGNYLDALQPWETVKQTYPDHRFWDEAWEQIAYTQWFYLEDYDRAIETLLAFVDQVPNHARAGEFLYDAGYVSDRKGDIQQTAELYERVANLYPGYEQAPRALFLAGIARFRLKDFDKALLIFQRFQDQAQTVRDRSTGSFWVGKCHYAKGNITEAGITWDNTASIDPTGYYSERARDILHGRPPFTPPDSYDLGFDLQAERFQAEEWVRTKFSLPADYDFTGLGTLTNDARILRGEELWSLGLFDDARSEFEKVRLEVASDPALSFQLTNYLVELGSYRSAIMAARQVLDLALMDDATSISAPAFFNHVRFGTYYSDLLIPISQQYDFHPLFLFSLVRQESLFEGFVSSTAGARGLMQIIPQTGADIAQNMGWPPDYTAEDLYRPLISLTFGSEYLDKQRAFFDGDVYAALAAYNGGPGNAARWHELAPDDPDLFLEIISYEETRNYIRGIYEIFNLYRAIYSRAFGG